MIRLIGGLMVFGLSMPVAIALTPSYVTDPTSCPSSDSQFPGQNCSGGLDICGVDTSTATDVTQCYDNSTISAPGGSATSNTLYTGSLGGGYILDCFADADAAAPYCDNSGAWLCNRSSTCYTTKQRDTTCTAPGVASCGSCRSGYQDCGGDDACEIQTGTTNYPTGANNNYAASCGVQCDSGYTDCDASGAGSGNGCEIQVGGACTTSDGATGTYSGCTCVPTKTYFQTGTRSTYSTSNPLLWGRQLNGTGLLMSFANKVGEMFAVYNSGAVKIGNFTAGSGTGAGTIRWTGADFEGYDGSVWQSMTGGSSGGLSILSGDARYVRKAGDTMTGSLIVQATLSGRHLIISQTASFSGALIAAGNATVRGTLSGSRLVVSGNTNISGTLLVLNGITSRSTISGSNLYAAASISGAHLYSATTFGGAGLASCNGATQKLMYNTTTKRFECGTDLNTGGGSVSTGGVLLIGDARYVRKSGDTMTGALVVQASISGSRLIVSGHANISGALLVKNNITTLGTLSGYNLTVSRSASISGTLIVKTGITSKGSVSGSTIDGFGLGSCNGATQKLLYNAATDKFECGTITAAGTFSTGNVLTIGDARYVKKSGDTMTGSLIVQATLSGSRLVVSGHANISGTLLVLNGITSKATVSGANLYAANSISGSHLYVAQTFGGAGLADCDTSGTSKLLWDSTTKRFSCGTDQNTGTFGTGNVLTIGDARYLRRSGGTMTGQLVVDITGGDLNTVGIKVINTLSGAQLHAERLLTSSGMIIGESGALLDNGTFYVDAGNNRVSIGKTNAKSTLDVVGSISGTSLTLSNLRGCDTIDTDANGNLICGSDQSAGSGLDQNTADARYVRKSGSTMTGALIIDLTGGNPSSLGLNVRNTISGSRLIVSGHATVSGALLVSRDITTRGTLSGSSLTVSRSASISGTLIVKTGITSKGSVSGSTIDGFGLGSCNGATQKLLYNSTTDKFECGTITAAGTFSTGNVLTIGDARYLRRSGGTMTGQLVVDITGGGAGTIGLKVINTISGAIIHAEKSLTSSGTITAVASITSKGSLSGATIAGFNLGQCNNTNQRLLYNYTTQKFECGAAFTTTGAILGITDARYVKKQGDLMTGALVITITNGTVNTVGLKVINTVSGANIHAENVLSSSGVLILKKRAGTSTGKILIVDTKGLVYDASTKYVGIGTSTPSDKLHLQSDVQSDGLGLRMELITPEGRPALMFMTASGSLTSGRAAVGTGRILGQLSGYAHDGTAYRQTAGIWFVSDGQPTVNNAPGRIVFLTTRTGSGNVSEAMRVDSFGNFGVGTNAPGSKVSVSGSIIVGPALTTQAADANVGLEVLSTMSGLNLTVSRSASISGSLLVKNSITSKGSVSGSSLFSFGLGDCSSSSKKLTYNNSTGKFSCQDDLTAGSGLEYSTAANIFVNQSGDTMTGALVIDLTGGNPSSLGLNVRNTISGSRLIVSGHANVSGALLVVRDLTTRGTLSGSNLTVSRSASISGTLIVKTGITSKGSVSGSTIDGFGLGSCNGATQKLLYNSTTDKFECGTIIAAGTFSTGNVLTIGDARYVKKSGGTMTGQLVVDITGGDLNTVGIKVINTLSGAQLHAERLLTSSGMIVGESGALLDGGTFYVDAGNNRVAIGKINAKSTLDVVGSISGTSLTLSNLRSCDTIDTDANGNLICGSDQSAGSGLDQNTADARYVRRSGSTMTGVLIIDITGGDPNTLGLNVRNTISGSRLIVSGHTNISGALLVARDITTRGTLSGSNLTVSRSASISGTLIVKTGITSKGSVSGSTIDGFGLGSCNGATQKLLYNSTTDKFECGTISASGTFSTGNVLTIGDARYVRKQGDTMTGALVIDITGGSINTIGLRVINTISGAILHGERVVSSSGVLIVTQSTRRSSGALVVYQRANSTGAYLLTTATGAPLLVLDGMSNGTGATRTASLIFGYRGRFDVSLNRSGSGTLTLSGHLLPAYADKFDLGSNTMRWRSLYLSGGTMYLGNAGNDSSIHYNTSASRFGIDVGNNGSDEFAILANGNIGIGKAQPTTKLEVAGTMSGARLIISGNASVSGSLVIRNNITVRGTISGTSLVISQSATISGSTLVRGNLSTKGILSGATLTIQNSGTVSGALLVKSMLATKGILSGSTLTIQNSATISGATVIKGILTVKSTISGSRLVVSGHANISGALLIVRDLTTRGTLSGSNLTVSRSASISGTLIVKTGITSKGSVSGSTIDGFGLGSCNGANQKLLYNATTDKFECGTITAAGTFSTGNVLTIGDARYVKKSGDTMTGALRITKSGGYYTGALLNVLGSMSGRSLYISGSGGSTAPLLSATSAIGFVGVGTAVPTSKLQVSGGGGEQSTILITATGNGNNAFLKLQDSDSGNTWDLQGLSDGNFSIANSTARKLTIQPNGNVGIATLAPKEKLDVVGTISGSRLSISNNANISGALLVKNNITTLGTLSGYNLTVSRSASISGTLIVKTGITSKGSVSGSTIDGFGLGSCNGGAQKLLYNATTDKFECGTDQTGGGGLGFGDLQGIFVKKSGDTMTGALTINMRNGDINTIGLKVINSFSGALIHAEKLLTIGGTQSGNLLTITAFTASGAQKSTLFSVDQMGLSQLQGGAYFGRVGLTENQWALTTTGALWVSRDSSRSWTSIALSSNGQYQTAVVSSGNIYTSSDHGVTWTARESSRSWTDIAMSSDGKIQTATANSANIYVSTDYGLTWVSRSSSHAWNGIAMSSDGKIQTAFIQDCGDPLTSTDYGVTWPTVPGLCASTDNKEIAMSSDGKIQVTVASGVFEGVNRSTNYGMSWSSMNNEIPFTIIAMSGDGRIQTAGSDGGALRTSNDYGATWSVRTPSRAWKSVSMSSDGRNQVAVVSSGKIHTSSDYGVTWTAQESDRAWTAVAMSSDGKAMAAVGNSTNIYTGHATSYQYGKIGIGTSAPIAMLSVDATTTAGVSINASVSDQAKPAVLYGYKGNFDVAVWRSSGSVLNQSGSLIIHGGTGRTLLTLLTQASSAQTNVFKINSQVNTGLGTTKNNLVFRITSSGAVYSDAQYNSAGADYAEWFKTPDKELKAGELVCVDVFQNNTVRKCTRSGDPNLMGIVSTNPSFVGNYIGGADGIIPPGYVLVGLIGQVPAKVLLESGAVIRPGDSLTSAAIAGMARKARAGESTVGVALEGYDGTGKNVINVLISRRNQSLTVESVEQKVLDSIASMNLSDEIQQMVQSVSQNLNLDDRVTTALNSHLQSINLSEQINTAIDARLSGATLSAQNLTPEQVELIAAALQSVNTASGSSVQSNDVLIGMIDALSERILRLEATFSGSLLHAAAADFGKLSVRGTTTFGSGMTVLGNSTIGPVSITGTGMTIGSLVSSGSLRVFGPITVSGLAEFLGDVHIKGELVLSNRQAGFAAIPKTGTSVTVRWDPPMTATPIVTATPDVPVLFAVTKVTATGFTIRIAGTAEQKITFSYIALSADAPQTVLGAGETPVAPLTPFPVNTFNQPVSSDAVWNGCIQSRPVLDSDGHPLSCARYHDGFVWQHPDLNISFTYNPNHEPPILILPEGYVATPTEVTSSSSSSTTSSESSSSSSESSVSSSSSSSASSESSSSASSESSVSSSASSEASSSAPSEPEPEPTPEPPTETPPPIESADPAPAPTVDSE